MRGLVEYAMDRYTLHTPPPHTHALASDPAGRPLRCAQICEGQRVVATMSVAKSWQKPHLRLRLGTSATLLATAFDADSGASSTLHICAAAEAIAEAQTLPASAPPAPAPAPSAVVDEREGGAEDGEYDDLD